MEIVLTAILVSVILHTATGGRSIGHNAAIAVGSTVALLGLFASPISGASMNPARTLGPDIVGVNFSGWWVYVAGTSSARPSPWWSSSWSAACRIKQKPRPPRVVRCPCDRVTG
jgi:glycerol uptake facilitator-like aquaporin